MHIHYSSYNNYSFLFINIFSAMKVSYLQGGGGDPAVLSQINQLELEAQNLQPVATGMTCNIIKCISSGMAPWLMFV
jgi:hypothetical protein